MQHGGDHNNADGPDGGILKDQCKLGACEHLFKVFKACKALDDTGLVDFAEGHPENRANGDNDEDSHQNHTGQYPQVGLCFIEQSIGFVLSHGAFLPFIFGQPIC